MIDKKLHLMFIIMLINLILTCALVFDHLYLRTKHYSQSKNLYIDLEDIFFEDYEDDDDKETEITWEPVEELDSRNRSTYI